MTQIGGIIYLLSFVLVKKTATAFRLKLWSVFALLYVVSTFAIVPWLAQAFGRERIRKSEFIQSQSVFFDLANRNYVVPELNEILQKVAQEFSIEYPNLKIIYLDANFPFFDGFPLLPHLSHNDGKKLDVAFIYEKNSQPVNKKPTLFGYGAFVEPKSGEARTLERCKSVGYFQYDYTKFIGLPVNRKLEFSEQTTKALIQKLLVPKAVQKIFIEPHLKQRLNLKNNRIRFHGCQAVRHDDHIHIQL